MYEPAAHSTTTVRGFFPLKGNFPCHFLSPPSRFTEELTYDLIIVAAVAAIKGNKTKRTKFHLKESNR
jgi:hypothetical protein